MGITNTLGSEDDLRGAGRAPAASPPPRPADASPSPTPASPSRWTSDELLRGAEEVLIEHESSLYRLRRTSQGKLILTK